MHIQHSQSQEASPIAPNKHDGLDSSSYDHHVPIIDDLNMSMLIDKVCADVINIHLKSMSHMGNYCLCSLYNAFTNLGGVKVPDSIQEAIKIPAW